MWVLKYFMETLKICSKQNLWFVKIWVFNNVTVNNICGNSIVWVFKFVGTQKYGSFKLMDKTLRVIKIWVFSNVCVFKICGTQFCVHSKCMYVQIWGCSKSMKT